MSAASAAFSISETKRGKSTFTILSVISSCKEGRERSWVDVVHLSDSPNNCVVLARRGCPTAYKKRGEMGEDGVEG